MNEVNAQCGKVFVIGDNREKYSYDKKLKVIRMYLEGVGIRKQGLNVEKYKKRNLFLFLYLTTYVRSLPKRSGGKQGGRDASLLAITSLSSHRSFNSNEVQSKTGLNVGK